MANPEELTEQKSEIKAEDAEQKVEEVTASEAEETEENTEQSSSEPQETEQETHSETETAESEQTEDENNEAESQETSQTPTETLQQTTTQSSPSTATSILSPSTGLSTFSNSGVFSQSAMTSSSTAISNVATATSTSPGNSANSSPAQDAFDIGNISDILPDSDRADDTTNDTSEDTSPEDNEPIEIAEDNPPIPPPPPTVTTVSESYLYTNNFLWHIDGTYGVRVQDIWSEYTGNGVLIGIVDSGVKYTLADIAGNYDATYSYDSSSGGTASTGDTDPFPDSGNAHGTEVASIAAGVEDGSGSIGIAKEADIAGFRMGFGIGPNDVAQAEEQLSRQDDVDVSNNSWGFESFFFDEFGWADAGWATMENTIITTETNGRGGDGTALIFAAGNDRENGNDVNAHNLSNSIHLVTVAATDSAGKVTSFSTPGASTLVSAPGEQVVVTDLNDDNILVNGTSFASPITAGVVALMLEANPDLGYRDIMEILAYSSWQSDSAHTAGAYSWTTNAATNWNGGGLHFSNDYGFGLVDATAAVRLAKSWEGYANYTNMDSVTGANATDVSITDNNSTGVTSTISLSSSLDIDKIEVDIDFTHTWWGDLQIFLTSPDGTESLLLDRLGINPDTGTGSGFQGTSFYTDGSSNPIMETQLTFTFSSNAFWGEDGNGVWTLKLVDAKSGNTGQLNGWTLNLFGDTASTDDNYVYTDEYAGFTGGGNAARRTLTDSNGGTDTINLAALTTNTSLDLMIGNSSTVAGNTLTVNSAIEKAKLGNGDDTVLGSSANETIDGGNGADSITGGAGNDSVIGGNGADSITGGDGNDSVDGGSGTDNIYFANVYGNYTITFNAGTVTLIGTTDGTDVIDNIENFLFSGVLFTFNGTALSWGNLGSNTNPTATADSITVDFETQTDIDVLGNDSDADEVAVLAIDSITIGPSNGTASIVNGQIRYTPDSSYTGADSLTYSLSDGFGGTDTAVLSITVDSNGVSLSGNGTDETITAGVGDDTIEGGGGADTLNGGTGNDIASYAASAAGVTISLSSNVAKNGDAEGDVFNSIEGVLGSAQKDIITGSTGDNDIDGGAGADNLRGVSGANTLKGGAGEDFVLGGTDNDSIDGGADNDRIFGLNGDDTILGGLGDDNIKGGNGVDNIHGDAGADTVYGDAGADILYGDAGNDIVKGGADADVVYGDAGDDVLYGDAGNDILFGGADNDTLKGGAEDDILYGDAGEDFIAGEAGADTIYGGDGNDEINAGSGNDTIYGDGGDDQLFASSGNNRLEGGAGNDVLNAGSGTDTLVGGAGADILVGSSGVNTFVYAATSEIGDTIRNFTQGSDVIDLQALITAISYGGSDPVGDGYLAFTYSSGTDSLTLTLDDDGGGANAAQDLVLVEAVGGLTSLSIGTDILI